MKTYKTFKRSCRNWAEFSSARKTTVDTRLSYDEALRACHAFNAARTPAQVRKGLKMEFTTEGK